VTKVLKALSLGYFHYLTHEALSLKVRRDHYQRRRGELYQHMEKVAPCIEESSVALEHRQLLPKEKGIGVIAEDSGTLFTPCYGFLLTENGAPCPFIDK